MNRAPIAILLCACACTTVVEGEDGPAELDPLDYEELAADGKADGVLSVFYASRLVSDDAFFDSGAMNAQSVQAFFERTPYGRRSFLAGERLASGELLSSALVRTAAERGINPIVLLVTLQKERGLVSRTTAPSRHSIDYAFGCGCPDGGSCSTAFKGLDRQLACAADAFRSYADDLDAGGTTIGGFKPGVSSRVLDGTRVTPANRATAMLYTYTPWIQQGYGGNWLFWNIWRRYSLGVGYRRGLSAPFNEGFIGGACAADDECFFQGGVCRDGACSQPCTSLCPDRAGGFATSFCVTGDSDGLGWCVAQCDEDLSTSGCDAGQVCESRARHGDPGVTREVCLAP
jgi:hypothetical protein